MRPHLMSVSGAAGLAGVALSDAGPVRVAVGGAVLFVSYGLGQALTDVFQTDTDALSAPERPLVRGEIDRRAVLLGSLLGLGACAVALACLNPWTLLPSAVAVALLASYTPMKRRWWAGPWWNAGAVAVLPLLGRLCGGGTLGEAIVEPRVLLAMGSAFATYLVFVLLGYLKDVDADRATGYVTIPVRFGRRAAVAVSAGFALAGVGCSFALVRPLVSGAGAVLWLGGVLTLVVAHALSWSNRRDDQAWPGVVASVIGFVALHLGEAALLRPSWAIACQALLAASIAALLLRPVRRQV